MSYLCLLLDLLGGPLGNHEFLHDSTNQSHECLCNVYAITTPKWGGMEHSPPSKKECTIIMCIQLQ